MTSDQKFGLILTALTLIFLVVSAMLGIATRAIIKFTKAEDKIAELAADMREDRIATDKRLRWLEEHLWKTPPSSTGRRTRT